jgi:hypothetical protein
MESTDPASMEHSPAENSDIAFSSLDAATALASMRSRPGIGVAPDTVAAPFSPLGASYLDMNTSFDYGMLENEPLLEYTPEQYVDQQMPQQTPQTSMDGIEFNLNMMDFIPPTAVTDPGPGFIQADMFTPPEINIEYAPNSRQMYFEPPGIVKGGTLSAPSVSQTRNRLRVRSDPYSSKFTQLQDRERAQSEPPEPKPTPPKGATRESLESYIGRSWPAHSPDKPYICPVCDEAFQLRITRERHEITNHGKDKNGKYACSGFLDGNNWGCGVRFTRTDLRKHFRSEAGRNCRRPLREKVAKSNDEVYKEVEQYEKHKEGEKRNIDKEEEEQESLEEETNANPPSSRKRRKITRRKIRPSQKDFVLIRVMDPKRPDIARLVGERGLNSESGSDVDSDMEDDPVTAETTSPETTNLNLPSLDLQKLAQRVFDAKSPLPSLHRDSIAKPENLPKASTPASKVDEGHNIPDTTMENTDNMFVYDPATNIGRVSKPLEPVRQFNCDLPGCTYSIMGERFTVVNELQQHKERVHNLSTEHTLYRCTNKSCKERLKVWSNLDDLWQHVILMHPDNGDIALIDKYGFNKPKN